ncbi:ANKRD44 [Symbiodinium natans]|uniref:ANKRD44 protein n=1 Tax=Symbiodinium natans TaxID=878477 RepID=A0A812UQT5_9DINO|nr:ANKRD44 [Symbiodinium natans]
MCVRNLARPWLLAVAFPAFAIVAASNTEMQLAIYSRNATAVKELLASGQTDIRTWRNPEYHTTFVIDAAVIPNNTEVLRLLLEEWPEGASATEPTYGSTPLIATCSFGTFENAKVLVEMWPEGVQAVDRLGKTALHVAAEFGHLHILQLLLGQWPEGLHFEDDIGRTPMNFAACSTVLWLGCDETMVLPLPWKEAWKDVALNLDCKHLDKLSKPNLELWLQCGGDLRVQPFGTPLLVHVKNEEAKDFLKERMASGLLEKIVGDWRTWAALGTALLASLAVAGLEQLCARCFRRKQGAAERNPFELGAHVLVCRALKRPNVALRRAWRYLEIYIFVAFVAAHPLVVYWATWLPLVAVLYIVPGIVAFGPTAVISSPVLVLTTSNLASYVFGLLRLIVLESLAHLVESYQLSRWFRAGDFLEVRPVDASYWLSWLVDPEFVTWVVQKPWGIWQETNLQDTLPWAPSVRASDFFEALKITFDVLSWLYGSCLLLAILHSLGRRHATRCCGVLGSRGQDEAQLACQDILRKKSEEFCTVSPKIKPVVGFGWPWRDPGIYPRVGLVLLDIVLDINTVTTFLSDQRFVFAGVMAFVITRSLVKQMCILRPWHLRKAINASIQRGIMQQDLLDFLMEEKGSEAIGAAWLTAWSLFLSASTAFQMLVQLISFYLSMLGVAGYLVQVCDWGTPSVPVHLEDDPKEAAAPSPDEDPEKAAAASPDEDKDMVEVYF